MLLVFYVDDMVATLDDIGNKHRMWEIRQTWMLQQRAVLAWWPLVAGEKVEHYERERERMSQPEVIYDRRIYIIVI